MPNRRVLLLSLLLLALGNLNALAQQFSAELVHLKPEGAAPAKVFVSGDKIRFETENAQQGFIVVVDVKQLTGFMALPENQTYSELQPQRISLAMPFFHPADPENGCAVWEEFVHKKGTCAKAGDETTNGRPTIKYKGVALNGDTGYAWVDRKLNWVIKWEGQAGAAELRNIEEGPQSASLFEVPKDYAKASRQSGQQGGSSKKPPKTGPAPQKSQQ